ncbi:MAG: hypothetical protein HFJ43_02185 [Clostridia bacterium]|nr:hypothetical protein [Clostridia bacterium]
MECKKRGRPKGIKKDERLHIVISGVLKQRYQEILSQECSNISVKTCELISNFVNEYEKNKK